MDMLPLFNSGKLPEQCPLLPPVAQAARSLEPGLAPSPQDPSIFHRVPVFVLSYPFILKSKAGCMEREDFCQILCQQGHIPFTPSTPSCDRNPERNLMRSLGPNAWLNHFGTNFSGKYKSIIFDYLLTPEPQTLQLLGGTS